MYKRKFILYIIYNIYILYIIYNIKQNVALDRTLLIITKLQNYKITKLQKLRIFLNKVDYHSCFR